MKQLLIVFSICFLSAAAVCQTPVSKWASFNGSKIHYYDTGKAESKNGIVLIHGWSCNAGFWKDTYHAFPNFRVITVDLLGHGKSDAPYLTYSMDNLAMSVEAVLLKAGVKKVVVVGHSMGSVVARQFYRLFPTKTLGLVIVDMPVIPVGTEEDMKRFTDSVISNYPESAVSFVEGMLEPIDNMELKALIRRSMLSTPKQAAVSSMSEIFSLKNWGNETIDVPVFAIAAKSEDWQPSEEHYVKIAPKVEFQLWTEVSHFLHIERPALFNGQVKGWIIRNKLL